MEANKRTPNMLECMAEDWRKFHEEMSSALQAMIDETKEFLGEDAEDWDGEPRREIRDGLNLDLD